MIGVPMPNPRDSIIDNLNQQLEAYFSAGKSVQVVQSGVAGSKPIISANAHHERLRAQRDKLAPAVRAEAEKGITANEAAKNLKMHIKRVTLIAEENGFRFAATP